MMFLVQNFTDKPNKAGISHDTKKPVVQYTNTAEDAFREAAMIRKVRAQQMVPK